MNRRIYFPAAVIGLAAVVVAGCSEAPIDTSGPSADDLRGHAVTALDFPRSVFGEWEVTDPEIRPADMIPAIAQAVGTTDEWEVDSADCAPGGRLGAAFWSTSRGTGPWAGQRGEAPNASQSFVATVATSDSAGLNAVSDFAEQCADYTVTAGGRSVAVTTKLANSEPLRYGLSDARVLTTTATVAGDPSQMFSTLTGVGQVDGRVVTGHFTTIGGIVGAVINIAGNWWNIVARKAVSGATS